MLATAGLPDTFWQKSQTTSKKSQTGQKSQIVKQHEILNSLLIVGHFRKIKLYHYSSSTFSTRIFGILGCQICDNFILLWVARSRLRKYTKHCLKNSNNTVGKIFKKRRHQSDSMCELPPKKVKYWEKNKQFFWRQLSLKKVKFVKFGVKKQIWKPWGAQAACTLFLICWPVSDDNDSSAPEV